MPEYVSGEKHLKNFLLHDLDWYRKNRISLHLDTAISDIDPSQKTITATTGATYPYDKLLIATGGFSFVPPIKGADQDGVFTLRTVDDADALKTRTASATSAIVIGGGLLGLEAGNGLRKAGLGVSVVEFFPRLLPRQMDITGGNILKTQLEAMGFLFYLGATTREIIPGGNGLAVILDGGETLSADMVLISAGVRPEVRLAEIIGLAIDKGIVVDDTMQTSREDIYAAGDVIEHRGRFYGIWPASMAQGRAAGANMAGKKTVYEGTIPTNLLKVVGIDLFAAGTIDGEEKSPSSVFKNEHSYIYRKIVTRDDRIVGTILLGDVHGQKEIERAIASGTNIGAYKKQITDPRFDFAGLQ